MLLECGCETRCDHLTGERKVTCQHGLDHVVSAWQPEVEYRVRRLT